MHNEPITTERIDELLHFMPAFANPGPQHEPDWQGGERLADGSISMPYPSYSAEVIEFYRLAGQSCWMDYEYQPMAAAELVADDARIAVASLAQIKTMLTYCVRGERFSDGHWAAMIRTGRIAAILGRLQQLRSGK
jgi:Family of unknown function (DUF6508)